MTCFKYDPSGMMHDTEYIPKSNAYTFQSHIVFLSTFSLSLLCRVSLVLLGLLIIVL